MNKNCQLYFQKNGKKNSEKKSKNNHYFLNKNSKKISLKNMKKILKIIEEKNQKNTIKNKENNSYFYDFFEENKKCETIAVAGVFGSRKIINFEYFI